MKTILYAEDNALVATVYKNVLAQQGFIVDVAEDGLAAMKRLAAMRFDLVLLDLLMPKINGTDVLKYIRETPALKTMPVIILSDGSMADVAKEALALGVQGALLKSKCTPQKLLQMVHKVLDENPPENSSTPASA